MQSHTSENASVGSRRAPNPATDHAIPVAVVVVHYGDDRLLERCLDSVIASAGVSAFIVVVDNCRDHCRRRHPPLARRLAAAGGTYLHFPENAGFAAGANAGLRCARMRDESEALVVLNSDVRLGRRCLRLLGECLAHDERAGVVGPALLAAAEPRRCWNVGTRVSWPRGKPVSRCHGELYRTAGLEPVEVDYVCGAVLALRPEVLARAGFLNEEYYLYYEDADLSFRAREAGYRVLVLPGARAWHRGGGAFAGLSDRALYYQTRNRLIFSARWNPYPLRGRGWRAAFAARAVLRAAGRLAAGRRSEAATLCRAVRDYYAGDRGKDRGERADLNAGEIKRTP